VKQQSSIRIIGGKWRSRKVSFLTKEDLRPTPDRVRETLFNWLAPSIVDSVCLDLYAGSGVLGFEALSRGAKTVVAVEKDRDNVQQLYSNAETLDTNAIDIYNKDCLKWLEEESFAADIIFVDPPYKSDLLNKTFDHLEKNNWIKPKSLVYFESDINLEDKNLPANWNIIKRSKAGQVFYYLAERD